MLALMLNIVQFAWWTVRRDKRPMSHCERYKPVYIIMLSTVLIMVQPVSMLVIGSWATINNFFFDGKPFGDYCESDSDCGATVCNSNAYDCSGGAYNGTAQLDATCVQLNASSVMVDCTQQTDDFYCSCAMDTNALFPNTTTGWLIQVFCTYVGFIIMFTGVFMATKLHHKIARKWRSLRAAQRRSGRKKQDYPRAQAAPAAATGTSAEEDECTT